MFQRKAHADPQLVKNPHYAQNPALRLKACNGLVSSTESLLPTSEPIVEPALCHNSGHREEKCKHRLLPMRWTPRVADKENHSRGNQQGNEDHEQKDGPFLVSSEAKDEGYCRKREIRQRNYQGGWGHSETQIHQTMMGAFAYRKPLTFVTCVSQCLLARQQRIAVVISPLRSKCPEQGF
jgi:hypothetical protein